MTMANKPSLAVQLMRSPLMADGFRTTEADYFALVLAECARYGVPRDALALYRDLHAMLGFSKPVSLPQMAALSAPLVAWRSHPKQPTSALVLEAERLAYQQRVMIAFGGGAPGEMVGRAEICFAMGNLMLDAADPAQVPKEYQEIWQWASIDSLCRLMGVTREEVLKEKAELGWADIADDDVIKPEGRLYPTYQTICTQIRREGLNSLEQHPLQHPRNTLRPWAAGFLEDLKRARDQAEEDADVELMARFEHQIDTVNRMFPALGSMHQEILGRYQEVERVILDRVTADNS